VEVESDFRADLLLKTQNLLTELGVTFDWNLGYRELFETFWNVKLRLVEMNPRKVLEAPELAVQLAAVSEADRLGVEVLRMKFLAGEGVNPFQSKAVADAGHRSFDDLLYNEWGIHHFHLGVHKPGRRFAERSKNLLFALVRPKVVCFVAVLPHRDETTKKAHWTNLELVETIHRNWPSAIKRCKAEGWTVDQAWTSEQHAMFRKKGLTVVTTVKDGTSYTPPGGGYMGSGFSWQAGRRADRGLNNLTRWEKQLREGTIVAERFAAEGKPLPEKVRLNLAIDEDGIAFAVDYEHELVIEMGVL
jgi:hypothetical protein